MQLLYIVAVKNEENQERKRNFDHCRVRAAETNSNDFQTVQTETAS